MERNTRIFQLRYNNINISVILYKMVRIYYIKIEFGYKLVIFSLTFHSKYDTILM